MQEKRTRLDFPMSERDKKLSGTVLWGVLVLAKSGRMGLRDDIFGHYKSIFEHCAIIGLQSYRIRRKKNTKNKGYYAVQGNSR